MDAALFHRYQQAEPFIDKAVSRIQYPSDELKLDMKAFFEPKNKKEDALLFGSFSKYHHGKIQDAFLVCQKGYAHTQDPKFKKLLYLNAIIKNLK